MDDSRTFGIRHIFFASYFPMGGLDHFFIKFTKQKISTHPFAVSHSFLFRLENHHKLEFLDLLNTKTPVQI